MEYKIHGDLAQIAELSLNQGDTCWSSRGAIMSISSGVSWELRVPGGVGGAARRMLSGEGVSLTYIESEADGQQVRLTSNQPGKITPWNLADGPVLTTRGSFTAAFGSEIEIDVVVAKRAGAAMFGGAGLFLQKISGAGTVLIHGAGDFVDVNLAEGESVRVSTGNVAAFADAVDYDIETVSGMKQVLFGGEGLFMTKLTGPGRVLLQTLKRGISVGTTAAG